MKPHSELDSVQIFHSVSSFFKLYPTPTYNYLLDDIAIDTGFPKFGKSLIRKIQSLKAILLTHSHMDHCGNAGLLERRFHCPIYVHPAALSHLSHPRLSKIHPVFRHYFGTPVIGNPDALQSVPSQIETKNYLFKTISLPGHSKCSIGYYEPTEKWFFTGDAVPLHEKKRDSSIRENMIGLLNSLQKITKMDVSVLFTGHCGVITEVESFLKPRLTWLKSFYNQVKQLAKEGLNPIQIRKYLFGREKLYTYFIHGEHSCLNSILSFLTNKRPIDLNTDQIKEFKKI